jgi:tRNA (guanine37-N1)-methyltransferase
MRIDLVTAHPDLVRSPLEHSILRRAQRKGLVDVRVHDLRQYGEGRHRKIDDYPFGGPGGMVLAPGPLFACVEASGGLGRRRRGDLPHPGRRPAGPADGQRALAAPRLCLIAGHYKGIDQRVRDALVTREVSIGDYVLSGGELPASS